MEEKKEFKFKKGEPDWRTWDRVNNYITKYFSMKRKRLFGVANLRTDYKITIIIEKLRKVNQGGKRT